MLTIERGRSYLGRVIFRKGRKGSNQRKVILSNPILARSDYSWSKHNHNHTHPDDPLSSKPKTLQILNKSLMSWWCSTFWTGRPACLDISSEKSHQEIQHIVKTFPRPSETRILSAYAKVTTQLQREMKKLNPSYDQTIPIFYQTVKMLLSAVT